MEKSKGKLAMLRKYVTWKSAAGLLVVAGALLWVVFAPQEVAAVPAELMRVDRVVEEDGVVKSGLETTVYFGGNGKVVSPEFKAGEAVAAGQVLVQTDVTPDQLKLAGLQARKQSVQAQWEQATDRTVTEQRQALQLAWDQAHNQLTYLEKELERYETLAAFGVITPQELAARRQETEQQRLASALAAQEVRAFDERNRVVSGTNEYYLSQLGALDAEIRQVARDIDQATVKAPVAGLILEYYVKPGMTLTAGAAVCKLGVNTGLQAEGYVLVKDAVLIGPATPVSLVLNRGNQEVYLDGVVGEVKPFAEERVSVLGVKEQRVKVTVNPVPGQANLLKPGYNVTLKFTVASAEGVAVPKAAVYQRDEQHYVAAIVGGRLTEQAVIPGVEGKYRQVVEGLGPGTYVLLDPLNNTVPAGARVKSKLQEQDRS